MSFAGVEYFHYVLASKLHHERDNPGFRHRQDLLELAVSDMAIVMSCQDAGIHDALESI